jgi:IMP dehydrogenase
MAAVGVGEEALQRAELLVAKGVDAFHIDMAHGAQKSVVDTARALRRKYPSGPDIVAGNISSYDGAVALIEADIDGLVVGQGGGAICTTRIVAGIGQPQISAIWECRDVAKINGIPLCSDGGVRSSGDIVLALATGAYSVMVGGLLAGTDEAPGEKLFHNGTYVKEFYGMGSLRAMRESSASRQRYLHTQGAFVPEGIEAVVPYKGAVADILDQQVGGLRKGFHYAGARTLADLHEKAWFIQTTPAGRAESHPHDVTMVAQAPNYRGMQS